MGDDLPSYSTLALSRPSLGVVRVALNRPRQSNAMNNAFFAELHECMRFLDADAECRAVVMVGEGKNFSAGLDLTEQAPGMMSSTDGAKDVGREAMRLRAGVTAMQDAFTAIEECKAPVIAAIHKACIGGGIDMACACDVRLASADAYFSIREVDIGLAADLGTLQRLPKIVGNRSLVCELALSARDFSSEEALAMGLLSGVEPTQPALQERALALARLIASKSPLAVAGTKVNLLYSREHTVQDGLDYNLVWNASALQSQDVKVAAMAFMAKDPASAKFEPIPARNISGRAKL